MEISNEKIDQILSAIHSLQAKVDQLTAARIIKDYYSTAEIAERVERSEYQVREWCKQGRLMAVKRQSPGRGGKREWAISNDELVRFQNEGLKPPPPRPAMLNVGHDRPHTSI